jgi:hypothetical protein
VLFLRVGRSKVIEIGASGEDLEMIAGLTGDSCTVRCASVNKLVDSSCKASDETNFRGYPVCFWIIDGKVVIFEDHIRQAEYRLEIVRRITIRP